MTVADKSGKQIRQENARAEAGVINRVTWDMRYDSPIPPAAGCRELPVAAAAAVVAAEGAVVAGAERQQRRPLLAAARRVKPARPEASWPTNSARPLEKQDAAEEVVAAEAAVARWRRGRGALVDPGEYTVTLTLAGKTETQKVMVEEDPRVQMTDADRATRRKAVDTLVSMTKEADAARRKAVAMTTALTNLTDSWKAATAAPVPDAVKTAADDLMKRLKVAAAVMLRMRAAADAAVAAAPDRLPPTLLRPSLRKSRA